MLVKVTVKVSVLRQSDKYIDVETERAYNRVIIVTIEAHNICSRFDLSCMVFVGYSSEGNEINAPI
jgi:hypothetical protein